VQIRFNITAKDYIEAQRAHARRRRTERWALYGMQALAALAMGLGVFDLSRGAAQERGAFLLVMSLVWFTWFLSTDYLLARQYRATKALHGETFMDIAEDCIRSENVNGRAELSWSAIVDVLETKNLFMLYLQPTMFLFVPKRAFAEPDLPAFRQILLSKVPGRVTLVRAAQ
jgi:hypothetical protein